MENKLQQLTQKLYDEGLEKGRAEADKLVADAKAEARKIVGRGPRRGRRDRQKGGGQGRGRFEEHHDRDFAGRQAGRRRIKSEIASLIIAKATAGA